MARRRASRASGDPLLVEVFRFDRSKPDGQTPGGRPWWRVRARVPFTLQCLGAPKRGHQAAVPAQRAVGDEYDPLSDEEIEGPASSTSVDWYGTRMGKSALESMLAQFKAGVDYLPRHTSWLSVLEWDEQIGLTNGATLKQESVKAPAEGQSTTDQWVLYVRTRLWMDEPLSVKLMRRINLGRGVPGQSIGGWFTEFAVTYDEEGWPTDIEILDVELDHLAAVRSPANPDADRIYAALSQALVQARGGNASQLAPGARVSPTPDPSAGGDAVRSRGLPTPRHVVSVEETDDRFVVTFMREAQPPEDEDDDTDDDDRAVDATRSTPSPTGSHDLRAVPPALGSPPDERGSQEEEMDPKVLAELIRSSVAEAVAPLGQRIDAIDEKIRSVEAAQNRGAPAPAPAPAPVQAPVHNPVAPVQHAASVQEQGGAPDWANLLQQERNARLVAEARAQTAEQIAMASFTQPNQAGQGGRTGLRSQGAPVPEAGQANQGGAGGAGPMTGAELRKAPIPGPGGINLREVTPRAIRAHLGSMGEVPYSAQLVYEEDGPKACANLAKAEGSSFALADMVLEDPALHTEGQRGVRMLAARFRGASNWSGDKSEGNARDTDAWQDGRETLVEVIRAAWDDGLIAPRTKFANWAQ